MPTGDGLLARLMPSAPIPLDAFDALCDASQTHGNGIVEVTQRGSLQIRGLSPASAPVFARTAFTLGLAAEERPPILTSPLMGLDAQECLDLHPLVAALRKDLTNRPTNAELTHFPFSFFANLAICADFFPISSSSACSYTLKASNKLMRVRSF